MEEVSKPWGSFIVLDTGEGFQVKRISVIPGAALSLQSHKHRSEHWVVVKGEALVTKDETTVTLRKNESIFIEVGIKHRLENPNEGLMELVEVQLGEYLGEDDIERYEDLYGRLNPDTP